LGPRFNSSDLQFEVVSFFKGLWEMVRAVLAVVVGLFAMLAINMLGIAGMWFGLGWQFAFEGNGPRASNGWIFGMLCGGLAGTFVGGYLCSAVAGSRRRAAVMSLSGLALVLALLGAMMGKSVEQSRLPQGKSAAQLNFAEASEYAVSPAWYYLTSGILGPSVVWLGGRRRN
jgi:hypothetical protein